MKKIESLIDQGYMRQLSVYALQDIPQQLDLNDDVMKKIEELVQERFGNRLLLSEIISMSQ